MVHGDARGGGRLTSKNCRPWRRPASRHRQVLRFGALIRPCHSWAADTFTHHTTALLLRHYCCSAADCTPPTPAAPRRPRPLAHRPIATRYVTAPTMAATSPRPRALLPGYVILILSHFIFFSLSPYLSLALCIVGKLLEFDPSDNPATGRRRTA